MIDIQIQTEGESTQVRPTTIRSIMIIISGLILLISLEPQAIAGLH
jgi:hypothetical protein